MSASGSEGGAATEALSEAVLGQPDIAGLVCGHVGDADLLAFALSCRGFRAAQLQSSRPLHTPAAAAAFSPARLFWALSLDFPGDKLCAYAARTGDLSLLEWAREECGLEWDEHTSEGAARGGHLEVLRYCRERNCPWDSQTCAAAAAGGHLELLQWARSEGCPWNETCCTGAADHGHLNVLRWARGQGCPWWHR